MHIIEPCKTSVSLFRDDGEVWAFKSLSEARRALGMAFIRQHVGRHFVEYLYDEKRWGARPDGSHGLVSSAPVYERHKYVMRDDAGKPVTAAAFELPRRPYVYRGRHHCPTWNGDGAVPGTGHGWRYKQWRRMRTRQERRLNGYSTEGTFEGEPRARAARSASILPDPWSDFSRHYERNWKGYRRNQWAE